MTPEQINARRVQAEDRLDTVLVNFRAYPTFDNMLRAKDAVFNLFWWAQALPEDFPDAYRTSPDCSVQPAGETNGIP